MSINVYPDNSETSIISPTTAFGEVRVSNLSPENQIQCPYGLLNTNYIETFSDTGGSADTNGNLFRCQSGTSVGGYGVIRTKRTSQYRPGQAILSRITAKFTTGVTNSLQFCGMFSLTDTLAFGYDGETYGIIHEYDGAAEVQTIQITATPGGPENATVVLDSDSVSCPITSSDVQTNANEIQVALEADATVDSKWRFEQINDSVVCISKSVGDKTGTFSFSSSTATGSITEDKAGSDKTKSTIAQSSWNIDTADWIDPTYLNVYQINYGYLGAVGPRFSVYDPNSFKFIDVHEIKWANANNSPILANPTMKIGWTSASLGSSGTNLTVEGASAMAGTEGNNKILSTSKALSNTKSSVGTSYENIITIKSRITYGDIYNLGYIVPLSVSVDNDHNKGVIVELIKNSTLGGTTNYQYVDENNSIVTYDVSGTTVTGGEVIKLFTVSSNSSVEIDLKEYNQRILPEETLTVAVKTVSGTANNTTVAINWGEEI